MGVPGFFAWLLKQDKQNKILKRNIQNKSHTLFFDANCLFHPQCFKILKFYPFESSIDKLEHMMMERIINYIKFIIDYVNPQDLVYIAVDGVAPLAKINQQRKRRYKSVEENTIKNNIYKKYDIPNNTSWSNIVITPGTEFMKKLDKKIKECISSNKLLNQHNTNQVKIIYSSYEEKGEGEHKILQYLKNNYKNNTEKTHIVYGLDADLIFLTLASNMENIYLLREQSNFGKPSKAPQIKEEQLNPITDVEEPMTYVSILDSRKVFNKYFKSRLDINDDFINFNTNQENQQNNQQNIDFINDFIFMCYFLGNDFLPHIPSINIREEGIEYLIDAYVFAFERTDELMIQQTIPNIKYGLKTIELFLSYLADIENSYFKDNSYKKQYKHLYPPSYINKLHEKELWEIENLTNDMFKNIKEVINKDPFNLVNPHINMETSKNNYYEHHFNMKFNVKNQIKNVTHSFFEVLKWVSEYYFKEASSWNIQYIYDASPFISDLYQNFKQFNEIEIKKDNQSLTIHQQLLSVIPPNKKDILDKSVQNKMNNMQIKYMLPEKVTYDFAYKDKFWLCEAIMPYLDYEIISKT
jgi:5'-3' exonuclease